MTITGGDLDSSGFSSIFAEIIEETEEFEEAIDNIGSVFGTTFTNLIEQSLNISDDFVPWEGLNLDVLKIFNYFNYLITVEMESLTLGWEGSHSDTGDSDHWPVRIEDKKRFGYAPAGMTDVFNAQHNYYAEMGDINEDGIVNVVDIVTLVDLIQL